MHQGHTDRQLKSLFLPAGGDKTSGKASAVLIGGHWPEHTHSPPANNANKQEQQQAGGTPTDGGLRSLRLSNYVSHTSILSTSSAAPRASHIVTVLRSGAIEVFNMTNDACGPYVQHTIPIPDKATAAHIGLTANNNGGMHLEGFAKSKITCASLIPAEIALRQRSEEVGYITPGPVAAASEKNGAATGVAAVGTGAPSGPVAARLGLDDDLDHYYSPPDSGREGSVSAHKTFSATSPSEPFGGTFNGTSPAVMMKSNVQPAADGILQQQEQCSAATGAGIIASAAKIRLQSLFKDDEWKETVASLWRGVVGTNFGEVMVFDGKQYVLAFKCASTSPILSVSCVLLPEDDNAIGSVAHSSGSTQGHTYNEPKVSSAALTSSNKNSNSPSRNPQIIDMSAFSSSPARAISGLSSNLSMAVIMGGGSGGARGVLGAATTSINVGSAYFSVGFVTLQEDGGVMCWRRPRISGGSKVSPNPVVVHAASMFGKIKAIEVTHRFTVPMVLSNKTPHFPHGVETFIDEQRAVMGMRPTTGAGSVPASNTFANNPYWMNQLYLLQTQQQPLRSLDNYYEWNSPFNNDPEPLPLVSVVLLPENGLGGNVSARSAYGRRIDEDVMLDGKLKRTTAIQCDGNYAVVAREKNLFTVDYTAREIRRVLGTSGPITHVAYSHPIAIAGCSNGNIYVVNAHSGSLLAEYATYNASSVRHLSFHYHSMLVTIVDDAGGEVEVVQLPSQFLRHGTLPSEKHVTRQTAVMKFGIIATETGNNIVAKRNALDQRLMAQFSVPGCVQQYLSHNHVLK